MKQLIIEGIIVVFLLSAWLYTGPGTVSAATCPQKSRGDANCDGLIDVADFNIWRTEYFGSSATKTADFNGDGSVTVADFETWRSGYFGGSGSPTPSIGTTPPASRGTGSGIWLSAQEIAKLPMSGTAWDNVKAGADANPGTPDIQNQDSTHDVYTLAEALVYARTGTQSYRTKAAGNIIAAIGTEKGGRSLALSRNLVSYVIAADLIDLKSYDVAKDQQFRAWLTTVRKVTNSEGRTLIQDHDERPNNWGTHAGAARIAADIYIGDKADLDLAAKTFKGWLGDRSAYTGFQFGDLSWQCSSSAPVGVNPQGCSIQGHSVDGAIPDDMRRGCTFKWPPCATNYPWGALEGATVEAELLYRQGYDVYNWSNQAMRRATQYLYTLGGSFNPSGDDVFMPWLINHAYGTNFATVSPVQTGKNMGWTDWTHAGHR